MNLVNANATDHHQTFKNRSIKQFFNSIFSIKMPFASTSNQTGFTSHYSDLTAYNNNIVTNNETHSNYLCTQSLKSSSWTFGNQIQYSNNTNTINNQRVNVHPLGYGYNHINGSMNLNSNYGINVSKNLIYCDKHWRRHPTSKSKYFLVNVIARLTKFKITKQIHVILNVIIGICFYFFIYMYFL